MGFSPIMITFDYFSLKLSYNKPAADLCFSWCQDSFSLGFGEYVFEEWWTRMSIEIVISQTDWVLCSADIRIYHPSKSYTLQHFALVNIISKFEKSKCQPNLQSKIINCVILHLPGFLLSKCSASTPVISDTVVNTWAQCTADLSIQYRWYICLSPASLSRLNWNY